MHNCFVPYTRMGTDILTMVVVLAVLVVAEVQVKPQLSEKQPKNEAKKDKSSIDIKAGDNDGKQSLNNGTFTAKDVKNVKSDKVGKDVKIYGKQDKKSNEFLSDTLNRNFSDKTGENYKTEEQQIDMMKNIFFNAFEQAFGSNVREFDKDPSQKRSSRFRRSFSNVQQNGNRGKYEEADKKSNGTFNNWNVTCPDGSTVLVHGFDMPDQKLSGVWGFSKDWNKSCVIGAYVSHDCTDTAKPLTVIYPLVLHQPCFVIEEKECLSNAGDKLKEQKGKTIPFANLPQISYAVASEMSAAEIESLSNTHIGFNITCSRINVYKLLSSEGGASNPNTTTVNALNIGNTIEVKNVPKRPQQKFDSARGHKDASDIPKSRKVKRSICEDDFGESDEVPGQNEDYVDDDKEREDENGDREKREAGGKKEKRNKKDKRGD